MEDWNDSQVLSQRANEAILIANAYRISRKKWADAKLLLDLKLAIAYKECNIAEKNSYEKALIILYQLSIGTEESEEIRNAYSDYVRLEAEYKGLEKVLEAHQNRISLNQSLIKNQLRNA